MNIFKKVSLRFTLVLIYAFAGSLWILLSDNILLGITQNAEELSTYQSYKGWAFVLLSTLLIYLLLFWYEQKTLAMLQAKDKAEGKFNLLYKDAPNPYHSLDVNGNILDVNQKWLDLLGYEKEEVIGKWFGDLLTPQSLTCFKEGFKKFKTNGTISGIEFDMYHKNGTIVSISLQGQVEYDNESHMLQTHCSFQDISDKHKLIHLNKVSKLIRDINQAIVRIKTQDELLQTSCDILMSSDLYTCAWIEMIQNQEKKLYYTSKRDERFDEFKNKITKEWEPSCVSLLTKENKGFAYITDTNMSCQTCSIKGNEEFKENAYALELNHNDTHYGYLAVSTFNEYDEEELDLLKELASDIAYGLFNIENEQTLTKNEERYRFAIEGGTDGLWDWNILTNEVYYSPRFKEMLGYADDELENKLIIWESRIHAEDKEQVFLDIKRSHNKRTARYQNIHRLKHKNGEWVWVISRALTIYDENNKAIRMIGSHTDITEQKTLEQDVLRTQKRFELSEKVGHIGSWEYTIETEEFWGSEQAKVIYGLDDSSTAFSRELIQSCVTDREHADKALSDLIEKDIEYNIELEITPLDGSAKKYISSVAEVYRDENGVPLKVVGSIQDITQQHKLYNLLQHAEELLHLGSWEQIASDGTIAWSSETYHIFELDENDDITFEKFMSCVHVDDRESLTEVFQKSVEEHKEYYFEHRLLFADGRVKYVLERAKHFYDENNVHISSMGSVQDITKSKEAKQQLIDAKEDAHKRDAMLTSVFDVLPDLLFIMESDGTIVDFRAQSQSNLYVEPNFFLGKKVQDVLPADVGEMFYKNIHNLSMEAIQIFHYELEIENQMNSYEARIAKLPNSEHIMTIVRDITENEKNLKELKQNKEELETIILEAPNPIMVYDTEGKILLVNKIWEQLTGYRSKEIDTLEKWLEKAYNKSASTIKEDIKNFCSIEQKVDQGEYDINTKNGDLITWQFSSVPLGVIDGKQTIITSAMDITELKHKDEMLINQSRHAAMGEMISMIAHQWRQPLSIISMDANNLLLDVAMERCDAETSQNYAHSISKQTQHLSQTIDDFRNFFKPDKEVSHVNIKNTVEQTLSIVQDALNNNNITLTSSFETGAEVKAYARELMQVFVNIITNAKDALVSTKTINPLIQIRVYEDEEYLHTEFLDNAGGIEPTVMKKIFDPYFSTKDEKIGTGLGLYMSKMIIEEHLHGVLAAKNQNDGACFTVSLLKGKGAVKNDSK